MKRLQTSLSALILVIGLALLSLAPYGSCACNNTLAPAVGPTSTPTVNPVEAGDWYFYKDQVSAETIMTLYPVASAWSAGPGAAYAGPNGLTVNLPPYPPTNAWSGGDIAATNPGVLDLSNVWASKSIGFWYNPQNANSRNLQVGFMVQAGFQRLRPLPGGLTVGTWTYVTFPLTAFGNLPADVNLWTKWDAGCACPRLAGTDGGLTLADVKATIGRFVIDCNCSPGPGASDADFFFDEIRIY